MIRRLAILGILSAIVIWGARGWADRKETYEAKVSQELTDLNQKITDLQKRSESAGEKTRSELDQQVQVLREKLAVAEKKASELKSSGEKGWLSFRKTTEEALRDVRQAYGKAQSFLTSHKEKP